mmetsp:Transcript_21282/g.32144  ORF Transcript_21282/g.32144 Transcript_21282/m.32144 type:complete len:216 (+) Transcript_21282:492-1139(+)
MVDRQVGRFNNSFRQCQRKYAALNVMVPLEIYDELQKLPNLGAQLTFQELEKGMEVHVFPTTGNLLMMSVAAIGKVKSVAVGETWIVPESFTPATRTTQRYVIVTINQVFARGIKVPYMSKQRNGSSTEKAEGAFISDFAAASGGNAFDLMIGVSQLARPLQQRIRNSVLLDFSPVVPKATAPASAKQRITNPYAKRKSTHKKAIPIRLDQPSKE